MKGNPILAALAEAILLMEISFFGAVVIVGVIVVLAVTHHLHL